MDQSAFTKALAMIGGVKALAQKLGISEQAVHKWDEDKVPVTRAIAIEGLTQGQVTREDLRPDLYR